MISTQNRVQLISEKCKELRISFVKDEPQLASIVIDGNELQRVSSAKLLGLTITSNFTWNEHIGDVIKKSFKVSVCFSAVKKIKSSSAGYVHFLHCLYTLCSYVRGTRLFSCPAKVPKRRAGAS